MGSRRTDAVAGRVSTEEAELLRQAADEKDVPISDLVQRAVELYIERNPDEIPAFYPEDSFAAFIETL
jgi:hypothetical protein